MAKEFPMTVYPVIACGNEGKNGSGSREESRCRTVETVSVDHASPMLPHRHGNDFPGGKSMKYASFGNAGLGCVIRRRCILVIVIKFENSNSIIYEVNGDEH